MHVNLRVISKEFSIFSGSSELNSCYLFDKPQSSETKTYIRHKLVKTSIGLINIRNTDNLDSSSVSEHIK